ncbi:hypothetical protein AVE30378_01048 [Achromobacter veterisilvae]|uniref:Uncharacterized protein n=1 Tax=Achromobacter veterisilvae TaxID=2069367 RepID=A0A446C933_9BURK|nr:hypothetical protein [Achromobacter veterisilvae]SSW64346.1 hypothetical protein AVE30378_01048 [Achromobacter veterisilvae]
MGAYHAELMDDLLQVAPPYSLPHEPDEDAPTVTKAQAVAAVVACLSNEAPTAYGLTAADWAEHLMNELADNPAAVLLVLLIGSSVPSVGEFLAGHLGNCIEGVANRRLAEMDPDEAEQYL